MSVWIIEIVAVLHDHRQLLWGWVIKGLTNPLTTWRERGRKGRGSDKETEAWRVRRDGEGERGMGREKEGWGGRKRDGEGERGMGREKEGWGGG